MLCSQEQCWYLHFHLLHAFMLSLTWFITWKSKCYFGAVPVIKLLSLPSKRVFLSSVLWCWGWTSVDQPCFWLCSQPQRDFQAGGGKGMCSFLSAPCFQFLAPICHSLTMLGYTISVCSFSSTHRTSLIPSKTPSPRSASVTLLGIWTQPSRAFSQLRQH